MNIIVYADWYHKGFADVMSDTWFDSKSYIFGLKFLVNQFPSVKKMVQDNGITHANIIWLDSIQEPLYRMVHQLDSLFNTTDKLKIVTHSIPPHLQQSIPDLNQYTTISFVDECKKRITLPRDKKIWRSIQTRKKPQTPKFLPILIGRGMSKDIQTLHKLTKFPFQQITEHWDNQVVQCISKFGVVGIASNSVSEHNLLRRFWHTYGIDVLEDADNGLQLPQDAQVIPFLTLLSHKHNLIMASRTNPTFSLDLDKEQLEWENFIDSKLPFQYLSFTASNYPTIHSNQEQTFRIESIPKAKLIKEPNQDIARLPLYDVDPEKLPTVSVCTLTRDHRLMFPFVVNSLSRQSYPLHKIEWIILQNGDEPIDDIISKNFTRKLKRFHIETIPSDHGKTMGELRNLLVSLSNEPYVAFMDDDDIYFHTCLLARIKSLIKYGVDCVGSTEIGNYDLLQQKGSIASDGSHLFAEASMAFKRSFWMERGFNPSEISGESHGFLLGRQRRCISIPYHFNMIAISHSTNTTGTLRMIEGKELLPLSKILTEEELSLIETTSKYLRQRYRVVKRK